MLTHLTPNFAPQIDGIGDYSRLLAAEIKRAHGVDSRFIVGNPQWRPPPAGVALPFAVSAVRSRTAAALQERLGGASTVVLHYVCYGYHKRGLPRWVNQALRQWKHAAPSRRLIVVFHELWASGPPWKSECYLGPFQRLLVIGLHRLADAAVTSVPLMVRRLDALVPGKTTFAPIPSCVEPPPPAERRWSPAGPVTLIIFGQEASRTLTAETHANLLRALHAAGLLTALRVVGKGCVGGADPSADVAVLRKILPAGLISTHRDLPAAELAAVLAASDFFLSYYPSAYLCKSSSLTAAMACGCTPILPEADRAEPLRAGRELLACDGSPAGIDAVIALIRAGEAERLGRAARAWYDAHASWRVTTAAVAGHLP